MCWGQAWCLDNELNWTEPSKILLNWVICPWANIVLLPCPPRKESWVGIVLSVSPLRTGISCLFVFIFLSLALQELQKYEQFIFADHTNMIHVENVYEEILHQILLDETLKGKEGYLVLQGLSVEGSVPETGFCMASLEEKRRGNGHWWGGETVRRGKERRKNTNLHCTH